MTARLRGDAPAPGSARETAERIGWHPHTVAKRCENIRERYDRLGIPGLHGPRALEELATLLISTGALMPEDLRRLPAGAARPRVGRPPLAPDPVAAHRVGVSAAVGRAPNPRSGEAP